MMKYKGLNKIYFGIGIEDDYATLNRAKIFFYWFKLVRKNPEGEMLKRGRDYKGFILEKTIRIPRFGIKI